VAAAEALFNRGMARMEAGDFENGCPAIGESYRLDPRPGTLFTLAECEAKRGHIATAYVRYGDYLSLLETLPPDKKARQQQQGRDKAARAERAALGPQVPELTVVVGPGLPRGAVVKRDDVVLAEPSLGVGLPLDPGDHVVTLEVPGKPPVARKVHVAPGDKTRVVLDEEASPPPPVVAPQSPPAGAPLAPAAAPAATPRPPPAPPSPPPAPRTGPGAQRVAGYALGAVGLAGLGAGAVLGGLAAARKGSAGCGVGGKPDACADFGAIQSARALGNASTAGVVAGGVLAAAGVVLVVTNRRRAAEAGPTAGNVSWVGVGVLAATPQGAVAGARGGF
jgi:hypothetical protein